MKFFIKGPDRSSSGKKRISGKKPVAAFKIGARLSRNGGDISSPFVEDAMSDAPIRSGAVDRSITGADAEEAAYMQDPPRESAAEPAVPADIGNTQSPPPSAGSADEDGRHGDPFSELYDLGRGAGEHVDADIFDSIPRSSDAAALKEQVSPSPQRNKRRSVKKTKNASRSSKKNILVNVSRNVRKKRQARISAKKNRTGKKNTRT